MYVIIFVISQRLTGRGSEHFLALLFCLPPKASVKASAVNRSPSANH
nr:MAG TPA: hypothetical protein [Caudoviricetes sp.]